VNADCEQAIQEIREEYGLSNAGFLTAKDMENILFTLEDDQIFNITGNIPDPANIKQLDYSILNEVIAYIMQLSLNAGDLPRIVLPDWERKIIFNDLSVSVARLINNGYYQLHALDEYLSNNCDFLANPLRDKMNEIYSQQTNDYSGDDLFWAIVNCASPKAQQSYQSAVIVIMSKYFETCDIFEEPILEGLD
jgi:hypothetical protein